MSSAFNYLPIALLLISLSALEFSSSDKAEQKISLTRGTNGHMSTTINIKNATCREIKEFSMQIHIDAVMDDSEKDKEIKGLRSFFCPEKGEEVLNLVPRTIWTRNRNVASESRTQPADLLIVDGHSYTSNIDNYNKRTGNLNTSQIELLGYLPCNFFISDSGKVFEGLGWNTFSYLEKSGLGPRSLIIGFVKNVRDAEPSAAAINAFKEFVKSAICKNTLSPNYSLIPYYLIDDQFSLGKDSFERKEMKTWNSYTDNLDFLVPCEGFNISDTQIIPKEKWRSTRRRGQLRSLSSPIEYIIMAEWGRRCFFNCTNILNTIESLSDILNETLKLNFLLSEEGRVYEVQGWEETWNKSYQTKKAIIVGFWGSFKSYGPTKPMILALNALIHDGQRSGKLSTPYNIVTIKTVNKGQSSFMGDFLENELRKLDGYTDKY